MQVGSLVRPPKRLSAFTYLQSEVAHTGTGSASCSLGRSTWRSVWVSRCLTVGGTPGAVPRSPARCNRRRWAGGWSGYVATSRGTSLQVTSYAGEAVVTERLFGEWRYLLRDKKEPSIFIPYTKVTLTHTLTEKSAGTQPLTQKSV